MLTLVLTLPLALSLEQESQKTIVANLTTLQTLQQQLDSQRARLTKQQRRVRGHQELNVADVEQQRVLEAEINELRRRRDIARDANARSEKRLVRIAEECQRLQHMLDTPAATPFSSSNRSAGGLLRGRPGSSTAKGAAIGRPGSAPAHGIAAGGMAAGSDAETVRLQLEVACEKLARESDRRDTYAHMAARLRKEKSEFDSRYALACAALERERKRASQLRVASSEATQAVSNAKDVQRQTEKRIAARHSAEKATLDQQQATLSATQASVFQFNVSRMSRSGSAIQLDSISRSSRSGSCITTALGAPSLGSSLVPTATGGETVDELAASSGHVPFGAGALGEPTDSAIGTAAYGALGSDEAGADRQHSTWLRIKQSTGMQEPSALVHKALEQVYARKELEQLERTSASRLEALREEADGLAARRLEVESNATIASRKRLERLHEAVRAAESELERATARLAMSDESVREARGDVGRLVELARGATRRARTRAFEPADEPRECDGEELPVLWAAAMDAVLAVVRVETSRSQRSAEAAAEVMAPAMEGALISTAQPRSPSILSGLA